MKFKSLINLLNPFEYKHLIHKKSVQVKKDVLVLFIFSIIVFGVVLFPRLLWFGNSIKQGLNSFDYLNVNLNASSEHPVVLSKSPRIVVDLKNDSYPSHTKLFITKSFVEYRTLFFKNKISLKSLSDIKSNDFLFRFMSLVALLIYPGLILLAIIFFVLEALVVGVIGVFLSLVILRTFKQDLKLRYLFRMALYSAPVLFIADALFIVSARFYIPVLIWFLFFMVCAFIASKPIVKSSESSHSDKPKKKRRKSSDDDFIMLGD